MLWPGILVTFLTVVSGRKSSSATEVEQYLLNAFKTNRTLDSHILHGDISDKPCTTYVPNKPDFTASGQRISERKCREYIWEVENRDREREWKDKCELYLILAIKKGFIPDAESSIRLDSPVIFGGVDATSGEFPHMAALGWRAKDPSKKWLFKCGSTLISDKFLLTAAHCSSLSLKTSKDIVHSEPEIVRLGVQNIEDDEFNTNGVGLDMKIKRLIVHPQYHSPMKYYDIALIELEKSVNFSFYVHPACLWSRNSLDGLGSKANVTGWGLTEKGYLSYALQVATVDFLETQQCDSQLAKYRNRNWRGFQSHQMCAGNLDGGVDTCQGDSGGPLQIQIPLNLDEKIYTVVGVTSFGKKCGRQNHPGVYSRVSSFIDWIEETVWGTSNTTTQ